MFMHLGRKERESEINEWQFLFVGLFGMNFYFENFHSQNNHRNILYGEQEIH